MFLTRTKYSLLFIATYENVGDVK